MGMFFRNRSRVLGVIAFSLAGVPTVRAQQDVIVGRVRIVQQFGRVGSIGSGTVGLAAFTTSCNKGNLPADWNALPLIDHPLILLNMYRLQNVAGSERFEQIGLSWIKHSFAALNNNECSFGCDCTGPGGCANNLLAPGCSDTYSGVLFSPCGFNLGPAGHRSAIHPYTGAMEPGGNMGSGGGCAFNYPSANHIGHVHTGISHRLQVHDVDLDPAVNTGARYFIESQYIVPSEFTFADGSQHNNASHSEIGVIGFAVGTFSFQDLSDTFTESPAVDSWPGASVTVIDPQLPEDGRAALYYKVTNIGGGTWHYEYALYNSNLAAALGSLTIPTPPGVVLTNIGFHAPDQHNPELNAVNYDNDPWVATRNVETDVVWSTDAFADNATANAVRYGTMYNFRFDANSAPRAIDATVGIFEVGSSMLVATLGPTVVDITDCNGNGVDDSIDLKNCDPTDPACADCNTDGLLDECDIAEGVSRDCNNNGVPDECDLSTGTSNDCIPNGVPDECECVALARPQAEVQSTDKNRYLSVVPGNAGCRVALRVTPTDLPPGYESLIGQRMWVGVPREFSEFPGTVLAADAPGGSTWWGAALRCTPQYMSWSAFDVVHIYGQLIVPEGVYEIQAIEEGCDSELVESFTIPLTIVNSLWGDVVGLFDEANQRWTAPDGSVSFTSDVVAVVDKFQSLPGAPSKTRADVEPATPDQLINVTDFVRIVDAFLGFAYPFVASVPCPIDDTPHGTPYPFGVRAHSR